MDVNIRNLFSVELFGFEIWVTQTIFNTWLIMSFLVAIALFLRIKLRKMAEVPQGLQNAVEAVVETSDGFVKSMAGEKVKFVGGWFFTAFLFILVSNLSGITGLRPPTADWATTFALALVTFVLIQVAGIYGQGLGYFKTFFAPVPVFLPINLLGELARPVALSLRLFGNVVAGLIIMTLVYSLVPVFLLIGVPVFLHTYFDLFMGLLQTYVFCALSLAFIGAAAD